MYFNEKQKRSHQIYYHISHVYIPDNVRTSPLRWIHNAKVVRELWVVYIIRIFFCKGRIVNAVLPLVRIFHKPDSRKIEVNNLFDISFNLLQIPEVQRNLSDSLHYFMSIAICHYLG